MIPCHVSITWTRWIKLLSMLPHPTLPHTHLSPCGEGAQTVLPGVWACAVINHSLNSGYKISQTYFYLMEIVCPLPNSSKVSCPLDWANVYSTLLSASINWTFRVFMCDSICFCLYDSLLHSAQRPPSSPVLSQMIGLFITTTASHCVWQLYFVH